MRHEQGLWNVSQEYKLIDFLSFFSVLSAKKRQCDWSGQRLLNGEKTSMSARLRTFLAIALPPLLILVGALALGESFEEPHFAQLWSVEVKAFGLFAVILIAFFSLALLGDVWARRIDPDGVGRDKQALARLIDNASTHAGIAAGLTFAAYGKGISMWPFLAVIGLCGSLSIGRSLIAYRRMKPQDK